MTLKNTCVITYRNSKCVKLCKLRYFEFIMTIVNIYVVAYRDPICVKLSLLRYLISHIFYCFIIVITKVHTGIVIVLSMIIILDRMLRLMNEIKLYIMNNTNFLCPFGNKINVSWLCYLISCPYHCGIFKIPSYW